MRPLKTAAVEEDVTSKYDVLVIGTGAAASTAAMRCRQAGKQVAVVDSRPFGGTCALRGCDPKKVLVGAAELLDWNRRMGEHGIRADSVSIDWPRLMQFKRSFVESVPKNTEESFTKRVLPLSTAGPSSWDPDRFRSGTMFWMGPMS
jgi:glutathione reductase (NADPH)